MWAVLFFDPHLDDRLILLWTFPDIYKSILDKRHHGSSARISWANFFTSASDRPFSSAISFWS